MPENDASLRADARKNRDRIITVARELLATTPEASLTAIAKQSGVGVGTLYRHFPRREDLILSVYEAEIGEVVDYAPQLLKKHPPLRALELWFNRLAEYGQIKYGLAEIIHAVTGMQLENEHYRKVIGAIRMLLDAGVASGDIKSGLYADDVLLLVSFLWRIDPATGGVERAHRMLRLIVDGLLTRK